MATGARPAPTATPEPLDDPPGVRWTARSQGFRGCAHVRIRAPAPHGELDGVRLAEDDHARRDEPLGEGRGDGRHALRPHLGAARGDAPLEVDQILERDGHAVERAHPVPGADRAIGALGGEHGVGPVHRDEGVQRGIAAANPLEQRLDGVHGRQRARAEGAGQLGDGGPHGIDRGHVRSPRCGSSTDEHHGRRPDGERTITVGPSGASLGAVGPLDEVCVECTFGAQGDHDQLTISEARKEFLDLPEKLAREPERAVIITRRGQPVLAVLPWGATPEPSRDARGAQRVSG